MKNTNLKNVRYAALILGLITTIGVFGFMYLEDDHFLDALYLTVITISTVGFGLPHELSMGGKVFTIFLIIFSFGTYAYAIISSMPVDADNLFVVLSARALNNNITIVSRASNKSAEKKLHVAGVDHVVLPEGVGGSHMAKLVTRSDVLEFLDHLSVTGPSETILEVINYGELPETCRNKSIKEMSIRKMVGVNIVGYKTSLGEFIINPIPSTIITPDSKIFVLGTPEQIEKIKIKI